MQGIPENVLREQQAPPAQQAGGASSPPPATGANAAAASTSTEDDAPINLFEAAAQAGQNRGGAGGARAGRTGGAATGENVPNLDFLRGNPQFQHLRQIVQQQPSMLEQILQGVGAAQPQLAQLINQYPQQFLQLLAEDADEDAPLPPGSQAISVTEEEREAIERVSPYSGWKLRDRQR